MSNVFPAIPEPGASPESMRATLVSMKEALEVLLGDRARTSLGAPRLYLQRTVPENPKEGDLWINTDTRFLAFFTGRTWEITL